MEEKFTNIYNNCYTHDVIIKKISARYTDEQKDLTVISKTEYYYNETYILKEKIFRVKGGNKPIYKYTNDDKIFTIDKDYIWIQEKFYKDILNKYKINYGDVMEVIKQLPFYKPNHKMLINHKITQ